MMRRRGGSAWRGLEAAWWGLACVLGRRGAGGGGRAGVARRVGGGGVLHAALTWCGGSAATAAGSCMIQRGGVVSSWRWQGLGRQVGAAWWWVGGRGMACHVGGGDEAGMATAVVVHVHGGPASGKKEKKKKKQKENLCIKPKSGTSPTVSFLWRRLWRWSACVVGREEKKPPRGVALRGNGSPRPVATSPPSYILDTATAPTHTTAISAQPVWPPLPQPMQDAADRSTTIPAVRKDDAHTPSAASASYASCHLLPSAPTPPAAVPHYTHYEEAVDDKLGFGPANKISTFPTRTQDPHSANLLRASPVMTPHPPISAPQI
ncbi:hypothetical protein H4582DRAFT_2056841 [Lactarius indigo]|nr:hypothetical protein H4582DRAFT_2056841 [Lactarius indigo]